jgi:glycine cleavage system H protein
VVARNDELEARPDLLNSDAYGAGWIVAIKPSDGGAGPDLLDAAAYQALIDAGN